MQQDAGVDALLSGARRPLAGMGQHHLLPTEEGLEAWVLRQDWLILHLKERVGSRVALPLTAVDQVIAQVLSPGGTVRRTVLVQALEASGYTKDAVGVAIHRAPYFTSPGWGLLTR